jgi:DNA-binding GntR family transcriptional regulator
MTEQPIFRTIREQIVHRLRDDVISGVFEPGQNLREYALSKRYGVSRSPIRDALLQLTQEGLLVATPNCGVRVGSRTDEEIQPLIIDVRLKVELFAVDRAIDRIDDEGLGRLKACLAENHAACRGGGLPAIIRTDMELHLAIIEIAGNEKLLGMWKQASSSMMLHYERHEKWMESYREHKAIVAAIEKRDKAAAKKALLANIR